MALSISFGLGLFFIIGILIVKWYPDKEEVEERAVAVALGALIVMALLDLLPELLEEANGMFVSRIIAVVVGVLILVALDHFVPEHNEDSKEGTETTEENMEHIGLMAAIAIVLHNCIEGMTVYNIALNSISSGISLTLGIGLHNIPMGMLIYAAVKEEHSMKKYAVLFLSVFSTFFGGLLMNGIYHLIPEFPLWTVTGITLGMVLYIVLFELLPAFRRSRRDKTNVVALLIGAAIVLVGMAF